MFDQLRIPFFCVSIICLLIAFLVEIGSQLFLGASKTDFPTPGLGIVYLALLDGLLLYTVLLIAAALIVPDRIHGRIQGIITLIVAILTLLGAVAAIFAAIGLLMLMISLLFAVPFGTIVYFAEFAHFDVGGAAITLSIIMTLKCAFVIFLVLAHQRFLENRSLVVLIAFSLLTTMLLGFLQSFPPRFLVSITDDIGALINAVLAAIWALFFLFGSISSILKALRVDRALK
ncbi:hypothetical protein [Nitrosomonas sp.]|uniref:hypothetical protein n=1 Tax=Nitrosomonas sp. TaxID=42353 RepID=UPI0032EFD417